MVSLQSLLSRRGRDGDGEGRRALPVVWLAVAAAAAVSVAGLAGLGLAVVVVQTLDPGGGLPVAGSVGLAARLWLLAQGGELVLGSGPVVLAPLLLTLLIAWGLSRAARWVVHVRDPGSAGEAARIAGVLVGVHVLEQALLQGLGDGALPAIEAGVVQRERAATGHLDRGGDLHLGARRPRGRAEMQLCPPATPTSSVPAPAA